MSDSWFLQTDAEIPDYFGDKRFTPQYTWEYTDNPRFVNETAYMADMPTRLPFQFNTERELQDYLDKRDAQNVPSGTQSTAQVSNPGVRFVPGTQVYPLNGGQGYGHNGNVVINNNVGGGKATANTKSAAQVSYPAWYPYIYGSGSSQLDYSTNTGYSHSGDTVINNNVKGGNAKTKTAAQISYPGSLVYPLNGGDQGYSHNGNTVINNNVQGGNAKTKANAPASLMQRKHKLRDDDAADEEDPDDIWSHNPKELEAKR